MERIWSELDVKVAGNKTKQKKMNMGLTIYFLVFSEQI